MTGRIMMPMTMPALRALKPDSPGITRCRMGVTRVSAK